MSETPPAEPGVPPGEPTPVNPAASGPASATPASDPGTGQPSASAQLAEAQDRFVRLYADFENFKKRAARERDEVRRSATESVLGRLLPVLDTFEMAMQAASQPNTNLDSLRAGVAMIQGQLRNTVADYGVEEIDAVGKPFDPSLHEALSQQETTEVADGHVISQNRKGYRMKDRLLRPAAVVVARRPAASASPSSQSPSQS
jgi:molecular chaperone GrpE